MSSDDDEPRPKKPRGILDAAESLTPRILARHESRRAAGFERVEGKHVKADGLVSRRGKRRILPDDDLDKWREFRKDDQREKLERVAAEVLHGRNATIFGGLVLDRLCGKPGKTVEDLAYQFGVSRERIYRIQYNCTQKVMEGLRWRTDDHGLPPRPEFPAALERFMDFMRTGKIKNEENCSVCGRYYIVLAESETCGGGRLVNPPFRAAWRPSTGPRNWSRRKRNMARPAGLGNRLMGRRTGL
jgi:hypothetical protein